MGVFGYETCLAKAAHAAASRTLHPTARLTYAIGGSFFWATLPDLAVVFLTGSSYHVEHSP